MSILSGRLTGSAGLGGTSSSGPGSLSTFLQPNRPGTPASSTGSGIFADFQNASSDVRSGKVSLAVLESMVILLVLFYLWTHNVQGGG